MARLEESVKNCREPVINGNLIFSKPVPTIDKHLDRF